MYCALADNMNLQTLPGNLFDLALVGLLTVGLLRGRKHGMSEELMHVVKWLLVVVSCALLYEPLGKALAQATPFTLVFSFMVVYFTCAMLILGIFALGKHQLGGKLIGSDVFGRMEYYLGMGSGMVRFGCIVIFVLALLNARYFTRQEVVAMERFQNDVYGSNFFPTWHTAQEVIFERSISGPWIREHLGFFLIRPTQPEDKSLHQKEFAFP